MRILFSIFLLLVLLLPVASFAKTGWVYIHKGELFSSYALVERTDTLYNGEIWLIETGIGCMMWTQDNKWALFDTGYGTFLDGISDKLVIPNTYTNKECKIWDAFKVDDWEYKLYGYEKDQFLRAIASLGDLSSPRTRPSSSWYSGQSYSYNSSTYSCPNHSSESVSNPSMCTCDTGYEVNESKTKCVKISARKNDKLCQADFGKNSKWNKKYSDDGSPQCICKPKYEWNKNQTSCIKI